MSRFKPIKRDMNYLFPPSMNDWLPEHLTIRSHFALWPRTNNHIGVQG